MQCLYIGIVAIYGLVFGSFLNCMAMRIVRGEDFIRGHSHCMSCGHELLARDLIPVASYLLSGGKCRHCGERISIRYPISELLFAFLAVGIYLRFGPSVLTIRNLALTGCLFALSLVDLESYRIPDGFLIAGVIIYFVSAPFVEKDFLLVLRHVLTGLLCAVFMLLFSLLMDHILKKESLGGGDIKLYGLLGMYLGFPCVYFLVMLSSIFGLLFAGVQRCADLWKQKMPGFVRPDFRSDIQSDRREAIPFGPSIAAAGYLLLLFGDEVTTWYLGFL